MSLLKSEPEDLIRSLPELMAVAHAMEVESVARYAALARRMREIGNEPVRQVFEDLVAEEEGHRDAVRHWSEERVGRAPDPADIRWEGWSEAFDEEDLGRTRLVSPYRVLSVAVRNEERAFAFWSYVSAHSTDARIRQEAERLALEELGHVRKLRSARRKAFHAERRGPVQRPEMLRWASPEELAFEAGRREAELADLHGRAAAALERAGHAGGAVLRRVAEEEAANARALALRAGHGEPMASTSDRVEALPEDPAALLNIALERLEAAVELYFASAEETEQEDVMTEAQRLAADAVRRLSLLQEQVGSEEVGG